MLRGGEIDVPDKVGTLSLKKAVVLEPMQEHLMWGRLQDTQNLSAGSAVIIEPCSARSTPRTIREMKTVALLCGDGWLPVQVINPSEKSMTLRRNTKLADVFPCMALEEVNSSRVTDCSPVPLLQHVQRVADGLTRCRSDLTLTEDGSVQSDRYRSSN